MTALGMGTVFLCLVLLYLITRALGSWLPRLLEPDRTTASAEPVPAAADDEAPAISATPDASADEEEGMVAAMILALARHRFSGTSLVVDESTGIDPWKIAGRIRTLRDR
jgi:sodium pump decarboxylase gamma subunit